MNKRKILALAMALSMVAILAVGATLAYFTDTDKATNTFTLGNVKIELVEQQRKYDEKGVVTGFETFTGDKVLLPIVGSAQDDTQKDKFGMSTAANYVDKIVDVENTGKSDAYVRVFIAYPVELDAAKAADMVLHWNQANDFDRDGNYTAGSEHTVPWTGVQVMDENNAPVIATINNIAYNVYCYEYTKALAPKATTEYPALVGVYMDSRVDFDGEKYTMGDKVLDSAKFIDDEGKVNLPVFVQAVQVAGFKTPAEAFEAAALTNNPWAN